MRNKRINLKTYILGSFILILFLLFIIIKIYIKNTSNNIALYSRELINHKIDKIINNSINYYNNINNEVNFFKIYYNDNNEIIYLDQDINSTYNYINSLLSYFNKKINNKNIYIKVPYNFKQNILFYNFYPKINIKVNNIKSMVANIDTIVKEYGINNALIQNYINIEIKYVINGGLSLKETKYKYKYLLSSKIITGKVPSIYGKEYSSSSNIFDIPIK